MTISKKKISDIVVWTVCLCYAGLFLDISLSNITILILLLVCLFTITFRQAKSAIGSARPVQLLIGFYLLHVVGLWYSENFSNGLFVLEKKVTLLLMLLLLFPAASQLSNQQKSKLVLWLGIITLASSLFFLAMATFKVLSGNDPLAFHRDYFASIPYVFYSLYFATGSLLLINTAYQRIVALRLRLIVVLALISYSLTLLVIISSKTGILAFVSGLTMLLYMKLQSKRVFYASMTGIIIALFLLLALYPSTLDRFKELTKNFQVVEQEALTEAEEFNGLNLRLFFWKTSLVQLWEDKNMITGVGTGDAQDYLDMAYTKRHLDQYGYLGFDPHNQWIITLLQLGLLGVVLLAAALMLAWREALRKKNLDVIFLMWVFLCFSFSEVVLESNKGIVFFALFFAMLAPTPESSTTLAEDNHH